MSIAHTTPAPLTIAVLKAMGLMEWMPFQDYLVGVVAAEMPADFEFEALKAQAVAARSYTIHCASMAKHGNAHICTDFACCQAWQDSDQLQSKWEGSYEENLVKIRGAVNATRGEYLVSEGRAILAAFHSSSAGRTANSADVWSASLPYLISVPSPETGEDVPHYVSTVICSPEDFAATILSAHPEAVFPDADEFNWMGQTLLDNTGRVSTVVLGGVAIKGKEMRKLFSLRSTAFVLTYISGTFTFTVTGFGHGVGMSQYGANKMARLGANYRDILAHYYPKTVLVR